MVNAQIDGDSIVYKHYVNMGIAVASDAGLVVPNIKDADRKGMLDLSRDIAAVAKRARDGKLTMDDLTGGTFTITNGGVFGSLVSTPIINYPAGRHPRPAQDPGPPGRDRRPGRDPADDVRRALVRPPDHRRPAGGAVPRTRQGADGRSGRDADRREMHARSGRCRRHRRRTRRLRRRHPRRAARPQHRLRRDGQDARRHLRQRRLHSVEGAAQVVGALRVRAAARRRARREARRSVGSTSRRC